MRLDTKTTGVKKMGHSNSIGLTIYRIILSVLALYFFVMGAFLILFPNLLLLGLGQQTSPAIIGIIRGAGGATIPYALLYIFLALKPEENRWIKYAIVLANGLAILLDLNSLLLSEYTPMQAMIDLPVEVISLMVILFQSRFMVR